MCLIILQTIRRSKLVINSGEEFGSNRCFRRKLPVKSREVKTHFFYEVESEKFMDFSSIFQANISPSLHCATPADIAVKTQLAKDVLNLCGVQFPPNISSKCSSSCIDYRVKPCDRNKNDEDLAKERYHLDCFQKIDPKILNELTGSDTRILIDFEDEYARCGNFDLLFPTAETFDYVKYYNPPIAYSNLLLAQWQVEQANRGRDVGIAILEEICRNGDHFADSNDFNLFENGAV
ncbi:unnamed protein product [Gongylonema pulchrum]|uniref:Uncharacterized protein n=1 Tax=Gongylonema pulchrum TaxID=637853 RepID=A0A183D7A6_9BILA|nr:unnamed protein product [Gongylonema pulchrum]